MKIQDLPQNTQPRHRLQTIGPATLQDHELLAILIGFGSKKQNVLELAQSLIQKYSSLSRLARTSYQELKNTHGIGPAHASKLIAAFELARRLQTQEQTKTTITSAKDIYLLNKNKFIGIEQETVNAIYLDIKNNILHQETITRGTLTSVLIHPREVFQRAIANGAASIILFHNHPSGDPTPSKEDEEITNIMKESGEIIGIGLLDHIIIGKNQYYSFKEQGQI